MRNLADLILDLQHAADYDRLLDQQIAILLGYKRIVSMKQGVGGKQERQVVWMSQTDENTSRIPNFTGDFDAAIGLVETIVPGCTAAVSWHHRGSSAKIDDGPSFYGATPCLALCVAALSAKHRLEYE